MKDLNLLVWMTQLGMSVAVPLAGFTGLSVWLKNRFDLGVWIVLVGCAVGICCAVDGMRHSLRLMSQMGRKKDKAASPPVSYNDHE